MRLGRVASPPHHAAIKQVQAYRSQAIPRPSSRQVKTACLPPWTRTSTRPEADLPTAGTAASNAAPHGLRTRWSKH
jgi:hypothetical protein